MVAPIKELRNAMHNEASKWSGQLERNIDSSITRAASEGYTGIDKFYFSTRLDRKEVLEVMERYEQEGYKTKVSWFRRTNLGSKGYRISVKW